MSPLMDKNVTLESLFTITLSRFILMDVLIASRVARASAISIDHILLAYPRAEVSFFYYLYEHNLMVVDLNDPFGMHQYSVCAILEEEEGSIVVW